MADSATTDGMDADWATAREGDTTLVSVVVRVERPRRVRVTNELDGPTWPPRRGGVPADGWDEKGFEGRVERRRALGYATPAPPDDPPVTVDWLGPADGESGDGDAGPVPTVESTPTGVVRALGDPRPPRDAVPLTGDGDGATSAAGGAGSADGPGPGAIGEPDPSVRKSALLGDGALDPIVARIERGEALAAADTLAAATAAVERAGGLAAVRDLSTALDEDVERLAAVERRARRLRKRAAAVEIPVETLERIA
jgi:hypothetical protein